MTSLPIPRANVFLALAVAAILVVMAASGEALAAPGAPTATRSGGDDCTAAQAAVRKATTRVGKARRAFQNAAPGGKQRAKRRLNRAKRRLANAKSRRKTACAQTGGEPAGAPVYLALGDSVAAGTGTYVGMLYPHYQSTLGVGKLENRAQGGATAAGMRNPGGQLATGVGIINAASDTRAVTIDIGGNDLLGCVFQPDPVACGATQLPIYRTNLAAILGDLRNALDNDPGAETFVAMLYYNPYSGEGTPDEDEADYGLHGEDGILDCDASGNDIGMNDIISQESENAGALVANAYPAFDAGGQSFMADDIHPNATGHAAIADAFEAAAAPC